MPEKPAERELLDQLFETSPVGIVVLTPTGELTRANERAEELLQLEASDIEGKSYEEPEWTFVDAAGEKLPEADHPFVQVLEEGPIVNRSFTMVRPHAPPIELSISGTPLHPEAEQPDRLVFTFEDITPQKRREAALERQNERLSQVTSVLSHDLRNPLNVAQGRLALAAEECDTAHLEPVAGALTRMEALIEDVLSLAQAGQHMGETERVELADVVEDCWQTVATHSAQIRSETDLSIRADRSRLRRLFENLFRNAIKHGGDEVTITVGDRPGGFFVADDGSGIPTDARETVFEAGYSTTPDGTGLGLNIVREIVNVHGWEIAVTDSDGGGARFEITSVDIET
jgi:PAS domain S-box-containing protein